MFLQKLQNFIYPPTCVLCENPGHKGMDLCQACYTDLPFIDLACLVCGLPLSGVMAVNNICGQCQQHPPHYQVSAIPFSYTTPLDHMIQAFKFNAKLYYGRLLGDLLADYIQLHYESLPDVIIPVPLHVSRQRQRGYNQALELGKHLCKRLPLTVDCRSCKRVVNTSPQSSLKAHERQKNVKDCFVFTPDQHTTKVSHVAILDDVITTGATVRELAKVLHNHDIQKIDVWACARTSQ